MCITNEGSFVLIATCGSWGVAVGADALNKEMIYN